MLYSFSRARAAPDCSHVYTNTQILSSGALSVKYTMDTKLLTLAVSLVIAVAWYVIYV